MQLRAPGAFGTDYGSGTSAVSVVAAHVIYGLLVGAAYAWLA